MPSEKVTVKLGVEGANKFKSDMTGAKDSVEKNTKGMKASIVGFAKSAKGAFLAVAASILAIGVAVVKTVSQVATLGDQLDKMAKRTGVAVETLSALSFAADRSGTSINSLEIGLRRLAANAADTAEGIGIAKEAFDRLGVSVVDAQGNLKSQDELLLELADTLGQMENSTLKAATAQDIFGRSGVEMLPLLAEGREGILALMKTAEDLGEVMTTDQAKAAADYIDAMRDVEGAFKGLKFELTLGLLPALTTFVQLMTTAAKLMRENFREFKQNRDRFNKNTREELTRLWSDINLFFTAGGGSLGAQAIRRMRAMGLADLDVAEGVRTARGGGGVLPSNFAGQVVNQGRAFTPRENAAIQADFEAVTRADSLANMAVSDTFVTGRHAKSTEKFAFETIKKVNEQFKKIPTEFQQGFARSLAQIETGMMALGFKGRGLFGGMAQMAGGLSGFGAPKPDLGDDIAFGLQKAGLGLQIAAGWSTAVQALTGLFAGRVPGTGAQGLLPGEEASQEQALFLESLIHDLGMLQEAKKNNIPLGQIGVRLTSGTTIDEAIAAKQDQIANLKRATGVGDSQAFSSAASITTEQANLVVAGLETLRIQGDRRDRYLSDIRTSSRNIEFSTGISASRYARFAGV